MSATGENGFSAAIIEDFLTAIRNNAIGEVKKREDIVRNTMAIGFSNASKIAAQAGFESLLQYFHAEKGDITKVKNILPNLSQLLSVVNDVEEKQAALKCDHCITSSHAKYSSIS